MEQIAVHVQVEPGAFQTQEQHLHASKISQVEKGMAWLLQRTALIGTHTERWARMVLEARGIAGVRVLVGLLSLTHSYARDPIDQACQIALSHGAVRLKTLRELLKRGGPTQQQFEFLEEHPIIRRLEDYQAIVQASFGSGPIEQTTTLRRPDHDSIDPNGPEATATVGRAPVAGSAAAGGSR